VLFAGSQFLPLDQSGESMTDELQTTISERFWRWLYKFCDRQIANIYLYRQHVNLKCPNCNQWSHNYEYRFMSSDGDFDTLRCGCCGQETEWRCEGGFWFTKKEFLKHAV